MESTKFLLLLIGFVEAAPLYSIVTPPSPAIGKLGGTAEFDCEVDYANILVMEWEFNNIRIYSIQNSNQDYPMGRDRYTVTQKGKNHFTLRIDDLHFTDAGKYTCQVPTQSAAAHLIVLDKPEVMTSPSKPEEGSTTKYMCTAGFTGPSKEHILAENYPKLQMFFDGEPVNGTTQEQSNSSRNYYKLIQVLNMTLIADMNQKKLMCDIGTLSPGVHVNTTIEVEVLYSIRNITYTPNQEWYEVGIVINCTADGNPEPNFIWDDIENKGNHVNGKSLTITEAMVGGNTWRCSATNIIGECSHQDSIMAMFEVVLPGQIPGQSQGNDASKIAMGVTIPVCLVIGCLIILFVYHHLRCNRHDDPGGISSVPLLTIENGRVLPRLTIFRCDDGRKWEEKIKEIYHTKTAYEVQTFNTLEKLESKFTQSNSKEGTDAKDKLMIILSEGFKDHVIKYAASLTDYPEWLPKTTVLVDLPPGEIPDWLEKYDVDYIDIGKYDDVGITKKILETIFGKTWATDSMKSNNETVQTPKDRLPVGSIAESMAWAYYFNYLQHIGPTKIKRIENFEKNHDGAQGHMPKKSFILLPSSCKCPNNLNDVDSAITGAGKLEPLHVEVAGNKRVYEPAVYKITTKEKTYFACVEYCGSVHVFYEMTIKLVADLSPIEKRAQLHTFYQVLKSIMEHPTLPQYCQSIRLVPLDDENGKSLSEILIKEIEKCLGED